MWQMIDEKSLEAYSRIKAPESLRDRVLALDTAKEKDKPKVKILRAAVTVAACLVLVAGVSVPMMHNQLSRGIFLEEKQIGTNPVLIKVSDDGVSLARMHQSITIPLKVKEHATFKVTEGYLQLSDGEEVLAEKEESVQIDANTKVNWIVEDAEQADLTVTTKKTKQNYEMYQDEASKQYYIKLKETKKL